MSIGAKAKGCRVFNHGVFSTKASRVFTASDEMKIDQNIRQTWLSAGVGFVCGAIAATLLLGRYELVAPAKGPIYCLNKITGETKSVREGCP